MGEICIETVWVCVGEICIETVCGEICIETVWVRSVWRQCGSV